MVGRKAETEDFATASLCVSLTSASVVGGNPYELLGMRMEPHFCLQPKPVQALDAAYGEDRLVLIYGE